MRCIISQPRLLTCSLTALFSCAPDATRLSWTVAFEDPSTVADDETLVVAWIAKGGCDSEERVLEFELTGETNTTDSTSLAPGKYGFAAEARDVACRPIAFGCVERRLPSQTSAAVDLVLQAESSEPVCAPEHCFAGRCVDEVDAGLVSIDADVKTVATADAGASGDGSTSSAMGLDAATQTVADAQATVDATAPAEPDSALVECGGGVQRPGGHCYRAYDVSRDFYGARQLCASWGDAWIVIPADAQEQAWLEMTFNPQYDFWIGLTDATVEGWWTTVDLITATWTAWDPPNPNGGTAANCAYYYAPTRLWRDGSCFGTKRVICERSAP